MWKTFFSGRKKRFEKGRKQAAHHEGVAGSAGATRSAQAAEEDRQGSGLGDDPAVELPVRGLVHEADAIAFLGGDAPSGLGALDELGEASLSIEGEGSLPVRGVSPACVGVV